MIKVKRLHPDAVIPRFAHDDDAGADLTVVEGGTLQPGEGRDFAVGIAVEPPDGFWYSIVARSSTLRKRGLFINPGVIDNGYRGPLFVYARNDTREPVTIEPGDRLAQMIQHRLHQFEVVEVDELSQTVRGEGGFGSTGLR